MFDTNNNSVIEAIPLPAMVVGQDETIIATNALAIRMYGERVLNRNLATAIRNPQVLAAVGEVLQTRRNQTLRYTVNEGVRDCSFDVSVAPVDWEGTSVVLLCLEDVTHVEQIGQMRRDFVANVSHELRTPLTAMIGFIETLRGPARNDPDAHERFLQIMEKEASRMNRLVADLLSLSRVEANERMRPKDSLDIVGLIASTRSTLETVASKANVEIVIETPIPEMAIPADADQLRQVFYNLVENAIKYGGSGKKVTITIGLPNYETRIRANGIRVTVADEGAGIDPVHIPRLTERFYRVDSHRSREMGGTGLGLAIVKHIVSRHRGQLRISSALGKGAQFIVILPVE